MNDPRPLSIQLDEAITMEEYHREQLLLWKQKRSRLEELIPDSYNNLRQQINDLLGDANEANHRLSTDTP